MLNRLQVSHRLAIVTFMGAMIALATAGFSVFRILQQNYVQAFIDASVTIMTLAIVRWAWAPGRAEVAGSLMCLVNTVFCCAVLYRVGLDSHGWIYLALMSSFYLAPVKVAVACSLVLIGFGALSLSGDSSVYLYTTLTTWCLIFLFSLFFSVQIRDHSGFLHSLASLDPLTQLPNRRAMETDLVQAVSRKSSAIGMLILDLDRFKSVNDTHGHAAGDVVLKQVAHVLQNQLRERDQVYRFGGEEFVMVLPIGSIDALESAAERMRRVVAEQSSSPSGPMTVSVGAALFDGEKDWQDWFAKADAALYEAKKQGGNRIRLG
ncbi:GGDEF domain-containing protein [Luteimonas fraxinea]|uniref:diguanylate cyclase n=1 Tax=Luteimonas fraxinea TaxID=2901869 RepID=A0ABS8U7P9_9GAMM|nr:GGDEF domain-containing protein [Luteimonas fraxinea]MCD9095394.1 GGDEF domain-containing protein [Luteimonas fraxinea]MCD9126366.1 GGDEF domain-containing protein [Luteimonas fraxinea]UHH11396.1 GGDEF domain-containing protein [Luteimonas fraxinea]